MSIFIHQQKKDHYEHFPSRHKPFYWMKTLLFIIGKNDCLLSEGRKGALISILESEADDTLYLLIYAIRS